KAVQRGVLLEAQVQQSEQDAQTLYFINSPKGRAALHAIQNGQWRPGETAGAPPGAAPEPPNIFRLYEQNIGPLTPLIAEELSEAESTYPLEWIAEAIEIAVKKDKRSWRYVSAILERWKREKEHGKEKQARPDAAKDGRKYVEGDFSEFVKH
ncbi:MAG: DnaD domain-containing protein, partial [Chloroflexota bacterium]